MPTKAEVDAHMVLHADYRDWCPDCVAGRGVSHQHWTSKNEKLGREFSLDYAFMTAEEVGEDMCPVLIGYDHNSRGVWAIAVEAKGAVNSSVQFVKDKIDNAGCSGTSISSRSDQKESILALKRAVAIYRQAETVMFESPVCDSKANGGAERAVRSWAGQLRTIRHHVERRLKVSIPKDSALMSWLVTWPADIISRYKVHATGRSSHEWITGHRCDQPIAGFAARNHFKFTADKNHRNKMNTNGVRDSSLVSMAEPQSIWLLLGKAYSHVLRLEDCYMTRRMIPLASTLSRSRTGSMCWKERDRRRLWFDLEVIK